MTKSIMLNNIHIISEQPLTSPEQIREEIMVSDTLKEFYFPAKAINLQNYPPTRQTIVGHLWALLHS